MSRTYRKHLAPTEASKRGGQRPRHRELKSHKQRRPSSRVRIRKEHL